MGLMRRGFDRDEVISAIRDAYRKGDKVTHNGSRWTSDVDGNTWEPGVYGWTEKEEA